MPAPTAWAVGFVLSNEAAILGIGSGLGGVGVGRPRAQVGPAARCSRRQVARLLAARSRSGDARACQLIFRGVKVEPGRPAFQKVTAWVVPFSVMLAVPSDVGG